MFDATMTKTWWLAVLQCSNDQSKDASCSTLPVCSN